MENNENLIVCQNCGAQNPATNNFCAKCAAPLGTASASAPPAPPVYQTAPAYMPVPPKKKKNRVMIVGLVIIGVIVLIGILGSLGGGDGDSTTASTTKSAAANVTAGTTAAAKKPLVVSVDTLMDALDKNALKAANTYEGKYVKVTGKLSVIDSSGDYFTINPLHEDFVFVGVQCYITDEQQATVAEFEEDQSVTVIGTITEVGEIMGYSLDVESIVE